MKISSLALGLVLCLGLLAAPSLATPLAAFGDHTGEDHSGESHVSETLNDIILTSANLDSIDMKRSILTNAIAISANFNNAQLAETDFRFANLTNALLTDAKLKKADFSGAIFDGADLSLAHVDEAIFAGASFLGADLSNLKKAGTADWTGAFYNAATILDPAIDTSVMIFVPEATTGTLGWAGLLGLGLAGSRYRRRPEPAS